MTAEAPLRVFLVEDHALVRAAVRQSLAASPQIEIVGDVSTAEQAMELLPEADPDIVLIDIDLPGMRGTELVRLIAPKFPRIWPVILTVSRSERELFDAIRSGARGFLSKDLSPDALLRAVLGIRQGQMPLSRAHATALISHLTEASGGSRSIKGTTLPELTPRENEVLGLLADGMTDREISIALAISRRTVESHVRNILEKLRVESRLQAARAYRNHDNGRVP